MDANVKNDEFAKLSMMDRISYGLGDFAQNLIFGTVGGFLLFYLTTVNTISSRRWSINFPICSYFQCLLGSIRWNYGRQVKP